MAKHVSPYPENFSKQHYYDRAMEHFSKMVGSPVHIDRNNCAAYLFEALRYRNHAKRCQTCGANTLAVPEDLNKGIGALYGANMEKLKGV